MALRIGIVLALALDSQQLVKVQHGRHPAVAVGDTLLVNVVALPDRVPGIKGWYQVVNLAPTDAAPRSRTGLGATPRHGTRTTRAPRQ